MGIAGSVAMAVGLELATAIAFYPTLRWSRSDRTSILIMAWIVIGLAPCLIPLRYRLARGLDALTAPRWRRLLLTVSIVGNLGLLAYFK